MGWWCMVIFTEAQGTAEQGDVRRCSSLAERPGHTADYGQWRSSFTTSKGFVAELSRLQ